MKKNVLVILFLFVVFLVAGLYRSFISFNEGIYEVKGLQSGVIVRIDKFGVPSFRASSVRDAFFVMGFLHAKDRLFQMELSRKSAQGNLASIFGRIALNKDIETERLLLDESIEKTINALERRKEFKEFLKAYCKGVNYFIENENLPPEFKLLSIKPKLWTIKDIVSIMKNMELILEASGGELFNLKKLELFGKEKANLLTEGFLGGVIVKPYEYNKIFKDSIANSDFRRELLRFWGAVGSNNWVVSGKLTSTGKPFLANDPHLLNITPAYFYQMNMDINGFKIKGNTLPGAPLVIIGRNSFIAWGFTNIGTDVIDYFKLKVSKDGEKYRFNGKWHKFENSIKYIKIKGEKKPYKIKVKKSIFGPVIKIGKEYYARHSVLLYETQTIFSIFKMNFAKNINEFEQALSMFSAPAQNVVFADIYGNIGYYPTGFVPIRGKGDGTLPVEVISKGDLWQGFYSEKMKPVIINPDKGFIVTANNPVVSEGKLPLFSNYFSRPSFRADRIEELLRRKRHFTVNDMKKIQLDTLSKAAEFLIKSILKYRYKSYEANYILGIFKRWDFRMESEVAPFLFYTFEKQLAYNIFGDDIKVQNNRKFISPFWLYRIMNYPYFKENEALDLFSDDLRTEEKETFKDIIEKTLRELYKIYIKKESNFIWEDLHTVTFAHPFKRIPFLGSFFPSLTSSLPGGRSTVLRADFEYEKGDFRVTHLSTFRMIIDLSENDNSFLVNATGQSGNPFSFNFLDQSRLYVKLKYRSFKSKRFYKKIVLIPLK